MEVCCFQALSTQVPERDWGQRIAEKIRASVRFKKHRAGALRWGRSAGGKNERQDGDKISRKCWSRGTLWTLMDFVFPGIAVKVAQILVRAYLRFPGQRPCSCRLISGGVSGGAHWICCDRIATPHFGASFLDRDFASPRYARNRRTKHYELFHSPYQLRKLNRNPSQIRRF